MESKPQKVVHYRYEQTLERQRSHQEFWQYNASIVEPIDIKTTVTKLTYRIEDKPGGGFIARSDDPSAETFEGATREEVQQKIDDKLMALVGDLLHHKIKIGDSVNVSFTEKVSTKFATSKQSQTLAANTTLAPSSEPRFESGGTFWRWLALLVAVGAMILYLLQRR